MSLLDFVLGYLKVTTATTEQHMNVCLPTLKRLVCEHATSAAD